MVRWIVLSYPSKNECGVEASALSGGNADGVFCGRWTRFRIVGLTNGGATNVLFFVVLVFVLMMVVGMGGAQCKK